jgi:integrase/recombinase XerD
MSFPEIAQSLFAATRAGRNPRRGEALILFILDTGARSSGNCGAPTTAKESEGGTACIREKGQKERFVSFPHTWQERCNAIPCNRGTPGVAFFLSEEGEIFTHSSLYLICKRIIIQSGLHVAPHKLRHSFAIAYLRAGGNALALQELLGHYHIAHHAQLRGDYER